MNTNRMNDWKLTVVWAPGLALALASFGCSATPIGLAMHVAGEAVNDIDQQQRAKEFMGGPTSQADAKLGAPVEVLTDLQNPSREWRLYKVPMDALNASRYVLGVDGGRVLSVSKVQQYSDPVEYAAVLAVLSPKVMGKSPGECEANLDMGRPLLTVRSNTTGQVIRLFDARVVKELQSPHYCVLRFGESNTCEKINLVKAYTSSEGGLGGN